MPAASAGSNAQAAVFADDAAHDGDDPEPEFIRARKRGWAHLIRKVWLDDPERCEKCPGTMQIVSALSSPGQDDVIRAILESTGQWDPPWHRRAPPPRRAHDDAHRWTLPESTVAPIAAEPVQSESTVEYDVDPNELWPED